MCPVDGWRFTGLSSQRLDDFISWCRVTQDLWYLGVYQFLIFCAVSERELRWCEGAGIGSFLCFSSFCVAVTKAANISQLEFPDLLIEHTDISFLRGCEDYGN